MNLDFLENLGQAIEKTLSKEKNNNIQIENIEDENIRKEEIELAKKLDAIEEFTIDRFEGDKVVLEDRKNGKMLNVNKSEIPDTAVEGDILKRINGKYIIDNDKTQEVSDRIKKKVDNLWN